MDGVPLQNHALTHLMAKALNRTAGLGDGLVSVEGRRNRDNDATLRADEAAGSEALHTVGDELETSASEIIRAADSRAKKGFRES